MAPPRTSMNISAGIASKEPGQSCVPERQVRASWALDVTRGEHPMVDPVAAGSSRLHLGEFACSSRKHRRGIRLFHVPNARRAVLLSSPA